MKEYLALVLTALGLTEVRMDAKFTQAEIATALTEAFVEHFNSKGAAQDRVQEVVDGYSRTNPN